METKDVLLSEGEKYFEKVMQDFNQNRKGRNLRKYCNDEGIDYKRRGFLPNNNIQVRIRDGR